MRPNESHPFARRYWVALTYFLDQRWMHFLLIACLSVSTALFLHAAHWRWAEVMDNTVLDAYFAIRGEKSSDDLQQQVPTASNIVLIDINDINGVSLHLRRKLLANLLNKLKDAKAKVVAFDLAFQEQQNQKVAAPKEDLLELSNEIDALNGNTEILADAIKQYEGWIILGAWRDPNPQTRQTPWQKPSSALWNEAHHSHLSIEPDPQDLTVRHVPLFEITEHGKLPCLGLAVAAAACGQTPQQFVATHPVSLDGHGRMLIDYVGGREFFEGSKAAGGKTVSAGYNFYTYNSVMDDKLFNPEVIKDKIVIIGQSSSDDIKATPFSSMPGLLVQANIAHTLLNSHGPPPLLPLWLTILITLFCILLLVVPLVHLPLWASYTAALVQTVMVVVLSGLIFRVTRHVLPASVPLIAIFLAYNAIALYEYQRARSTLGQFIGREMIPRTLHIFSRLRLGGREEEASAFFCDLRGFTGLVERRQLADVTQSVNEYTSALERVVTKHEGRPIDYLGDGVFVLFEPALAGEGHPGKAVRAALEFQEVFRVLQEKWSSEGMPPMDIGISIATGTMMIGIVGAEGHKKFGAVGDTVNVAARLQALSRQCGYGVLVTGETYERVKNLVMATYCGSHVLHGRKQPIEVYGVEPQA
jgi:class 3 adenylate cyclase